MMIGSPAPQSPPLRLSRAAPRQAARPVRPGHRPAAARPRRRGRACRPPVPGRRHPRWRPRQAVRPPRPCRPARGQQPGVIAGSAATSRAGHQRQLPGRARSGEHGHGVLATSAPRPASVMPAGTVCGDRTHRSARAGIKQVGATRSHCLYGDHRQLTGSPDEIPAWSGALAASRRQPARLRFAGSSPVSTPWSTLAGSSAAILATSGSATSGTAPAGARWETRTPAHGRARRGRPRRLPLRSRVEAVRRPRPPQWAAGRPVACPHRRNNQPARVNTTLLLAVLVGGIVTVTRR